MTEIDATVEKKVSELPNVKRGTTDPNSLNILQRINNVRKDVAFIKKDKKVSGGGGNYSTVTHDNVTAHLHDSLVKNGIIIVPDLIQSEVVDSKTTTSGGTPIIRFEATYLVAFHNMDEPNDFVAIQVASHALDYGDKAPGKALSYAVKYAMLKVFSLETGEDDEGRLEQKAPTITGSQYNEFHALCMDAFAGEEDAAKRTGAWLRRLADSMGYKKLDDLPVAKKDEALEMLRDALEKYKENIDVKES